MAHNRVNRILLLTSPEETPPLGDILRAHNPDLEIAGIHDRAGVEQACASACPGTRLISFCSSVIVPGSALAALPGPAYNFHPGPPTRPGRYPSIFALYDGDKTFGITVHEMKPKVDSGAIVAAEWFDIEPESDLGALERSTYLRLAALFRKLAPHLATRISPLPHLTHTWSGRKTTSADATALAQTAPGMSEAEIARRHRACGRIITPNEDPGWLT
jgi:methionyl-tRNA formyltransferase